MTTPDDHSPDGSPMSPLCILRLRYQQLCSG